MVGYSSHTLMTRHSIRCGYTWVNAGRQGCQPNVSYPSTPSNLHQSYMRNNSEVPDAGRFLNRAGINASRCRRPRQT